jgi:hypothetical protein
MIFFKSSDEEFAGHLGSKPTALALSKAATPITYAQADGSELDWAFRTLGRCTPTSRMHIFVGDTAAELAANFVLYYNKNP